MSKTALLKSRLKLVSDKNQDFLSYTKQSKLYRSNKTSFTKNSIHRSTILGQIQEKTCGQVYFAATEQGDVAIEGRPIVERNETVLIFFYKFLQLIYLKINALFYLILQLAQLLIGMVLNLFFQSPIVLIHVTKREQHCTFPRM